MLTRRFAICNTLGAHSLNSTCLVFFRDASSSLLRAEQELRRYKFEVRFDGTSLFASKFQSQEFQITLAQLPHVLLEAREIAQGTEYAQALGECGSRFEISIPDLDAALNEINSLMEVQGALQDASSGYLFLPWNEQIIKPWDGS